MNKILKDEYYAITATPDKGVDPISEVQLRQAFINAAKKMGFRVAVGIHYPCNGIAEISVGEDVTFAKMQEMMDSVRAATQHAVFLASDRDILDNRFISYPEGQGAKAVRDQKILSSC